ncbi:MAG: hypothetical protein M1537_08210 [Nitrospirae bacterium]|nr:hypothetical protein [Nitrospirota bacterium]
MDRRIKRSEGPLALLPFFGISLFVMGILLFSGHPGFAASSPFQVDYPSSLHSGDPLKIRVSFAKPPPPHVFYLLEVMVDGQPAAMADLSEERTTWVTVPPQKEGLHHLSVIWRNPPDGTPFTLSRDLSVGPKGGPTSGEGAPLN